VEVPPQIPLPPHADPHMQTYISSTVAATYASMHHMGMNPPVQQNAVAGGRHTRLLSGAHQHSARGLCGLTIQDELPELMRILDSYEDPQTKFNAVRNRLQTAQRAEKWINFTLRTETVKDFIKHAFTNKPDVLIRTESLKVK